MSDPRQPLEDAVACQKRIDELWDAGRDPLDDPAVVRFFEAHPLHAEAFAVERDRLLALSDGAAPRTHGDSETPQHAATHNLDRTVQRPRRVASLVGAALAGIAAAVALAVWGLGSDPAQPTDAAPLPPPTCLADPDIRYVRFSVEHRVPNRSVRVTRHLVTPFVTATPVPTLADSASTRFSIAQTWNIPASR